MIGKISRTAQTSLPRGKNSRTAKRGKKKDNTLCEKLAPYVGEDVEIVTYGIGKSVIDVRLESCSWEENILSGEVYTIVKNGGRLEEEALWNLLLEHYGKKVSIGLTDTGDIRLVSEDKVLLDTGMHDIVERTDCN